MLTTNAPPRRDSYERQRLFHRDSFKHHGKANIFLLEQIIAQYTEPGDLIVDPMAGAGSVLCALLTGRNVLLGDIEPHFAKLIHSNQTKVCGRSLIAFSSQSLVSQWDAARLPLPSGLAGIIITSPPYFDTFSNWDVNHRTLVDDHRQGATGLAYGLHPRQLGNTHIYENHLRQMLEVYREAKRLLRPGGKLILIVKDIIRKRQRLPLVEDAISLVAALGFEWDIRYQIPVRGSQFRNIQQKLHGQVAPATESVLVFTNCTTVKKRLAVIEKPEPYDGPGQVLLSKAIDHARAGGFDVWLRPPGEMGFYHLVSENFTPPVEIPGKLKAAKRRAIAYQGVKDWQVEADFHAGDEIAFYGSKLYGQYICQRLKTLGCRVTQPLAHKNNGQRLRWLTEQLS